MTDLFIKQKIVDYDVLLEMKEDVSGELVQAGVVDYDNKGRIDLESRSTKQKTVIKPKHYPDVCQALLNLVSYWPDPRIKEECIVWEFNYLIYNEGDHFKKHKDRITIENQPKRIYSTSTLISQSDDFEGGELIIYDKEETPINTDLKVGETVFFHSTTQHQVNPVTKGTREVLVAWIYEKNDLLSRNIIL